MSTKEEIYWKNQINLGNILIQRSSKILLLQNIGLLILAISVLSFDPLIVPLIAKLIPLILLMDIIGFFLLGIGFFFLGKINEQTEKDGKYILLMSCSWIFLTILWRGGPIYNLRELNQSTPGLILFGLWIPSLVLLISIIYKIKKVLSVLYYHVNTTIYNLYLVLTLVFLALFILLIINLFLQPTGTEEVFITREALLFIFLLFLKTVVITIIGSIMFNKLRHDALLIIARLPDSIETSDSKNKLKEKSSL
ncbi:MAG: hypothetical protein ACFE8U_02055 [Candidatus Hermodarchaeota archaeon]